MEQPPTAAEVQEEQQQPDLFELYRNQEMTMLGKTMTVGEWKVRCPLDENDPRFNVENMNTVLIKMANKAGLEIQPEHAPLFDKVLEHFGQQRKYSVAESKPAEHTAEAAKIKKFEDQERVASAIKQTTKTATTVPAVIEAAKPVTVAVKPLAVVPEALVAAAREFERQQLEQMTLDEIVSPVLAAKGLELMPVSDVVVQEPEQTLDAMIAEIIGAVPAEPFETEVSIPETVVSEGFDIELPSVVITNELTFEPIESAWTETLYEEPLVQYAIFTEALVMLSKPVSRAENETIAPLIVTTVAERLQTLEPAEQPTVAPLLQEIIGTVHGLQVLEAQSADPEQIEMVKGQLQVICLELFDALGIEADEAMLEQFMLAILEPEFVPVEHLQMSEANLEVDGTREAKRRAITVVSKVVRARYSLHLVLGRLVIAQLA